MKWHEGSTILITGGTGFAGSHLVEALLSDSADNIHVTNFGSKHSYVHDLLPTDHIHALNLADKESVDQLFAQIKPTHIFHLASYAAVGDAFAKASEILHNNVDLQINLLDAIHAHVPTAKLLAIFSGDGYKPSNSPHSETDPLEPLNPYGISKVTQEMLTSVYAKAYNLNVVKVRPFNHIGERQAPAFAISAFAKQIAAIEAGKLDHLSVGNLQATRDFTDVKDMVAGYILLMEKGVSGETYNIGSGQGKTMQAMLDLLLSLTETKIQPVPNQTLQRPNDVPYLVADASKIKALGWEPKINLDITLKRVLDYWRENS